MPSEMRRLSMRILGETSGSELVRRALAAYEEEQAAREAQRHDNIRRLAAQTAKDVRELAGAHILVTETDEIFDEGRFARPIVVAGGLRFVLSYNHAPGVALLGTCPRCGQETESWPIASLEKLGEMIVGFQPGSAHYCPSNDAPKPLEARLIDVLREFVCAVMEDEA